MSDAAEIFQKKFITLHNKPLAIYGLGENTRSILEGCPGFCVVALMDELREGEILWDLPVVSCVQAFNMGVRNIVIVARPANVKIVYRRISEECKRLEMKVYSLYGEELTAIADEYVCPSYYSKITEMQAIKLIDACDVVSFDMFDTLVARKVIDSNDIFCIVSERYGLGQGFYRERIIAERELNAKQSSVHLEEIYYRLIEKHVLSQDEALLAQKAEIIVEQENLYIRSSGKILFDLAKKKDKIICVSSDMYLSKDILAGFLQKLGFDGIDEIFVSSEEGVSKSNGLFDIIRKRYQGKRVLHIGDNEEADIKAANINGCMAFWLPSGLKLLEDASFSYLLDIAKDKADQINLADFLKRELEDVFLFSKTKGKLAIKSAYYLGYTIFEPVIASFVDHMLAVIKANDIKLLLLGARDGWLIKLLLDIYSEYQCLGFQYKYIYVSRAACTVAGLENVADIRLVAEMPFSGKDEELLQKRFLLAENEILQKESDESAEDYILRHKKFILNKAHQYRKWYKQYADEAGFLKCGQVAFFDFVSTGTCQFWLEKILQKSIKGIYFKRIYDIKKDNLQIESYFSEGNTDSWFDENYFLLEMFLAAQEPTLRYIGENGKPVFDEESRSDKVKNIIAEIQNGVLAAFKDRLINKRPVPNRAYACGILRLLHEKYSIVENDFLDNIFVKDEFCNREFRL